MNYIICMFSFTDICFNLGTPYWDFTGKKQFYISKKCATDHECKESIHSVSKRCDRIWYNDWECVECCHGDRCNYFVTVSVYIAITDFFIPLFSCSTK